MVKAKTSLFYVLYEQKNCDISISQIIYDMYNIRLNGLSVYIYICVCESVHVLDTVGRIIQ